MEKETKTIYIFDLDHTLLNAKDFRLDLAREVFGQDLVSSEEIWDRFNSEDNEITFFIREKLRDYLFSGVAKSLQKIKSKKVLLTYGNLEFQGLKVQSLGLEEVFDQVYLTDQSKVEFLKSFVKENQESEIIFINDNNNKRFKENDEVRNALPQIKVIEISNYDDGEKGIPISEFFLSLFKQERIIDDLNSKNKQNNFGKLI